jgi:hypothetical protein
MAGLVPAIHAFVLEAPRDVDARDKRGHDETDFVAVGVSSVPPSSGLYRSPMPLLSSRRQAWMPATSAGMTDQMTRMCNPGLDATEMPRS